MRRQDLCLEVNSRPWDPIWAGSRALLSSLASGDEISLTFPLRQAVDTCTANAHSPQEQVYTLTMRGSTLVDISPRDESPSSYPLYLREHMKADRAPMKEVQRFVPLQVVKGW